MFAIITDSASDLSEEYLTEHKIEMVPLYLTYDGENYLRDVIDVSHADFYDQMVNNGVFPKSSLPSIQDYIDFFTPHVKAGRPVICITISTSLSGSYNSATTARDEILEEYPDAKVTVINSTTNTITQGLFVNEAVRMRDAGLSYEDTIDKLNKITASTRIFFTVGSLDYLVKNGRIGKLAVLLTNKIKIRPIIIMKDNEIGVGGVSRTRAKSLDASLDAAKKYFSSNNKDDYNFGIGWGYDTEEGHTFADRVEKELGVKLLEAHKCEIGPVTICHTGPYPIGIACVRKYETV